MNKGIILGIVFLLILMSFTSISGNQINNQIIQSSDRSDILYVGGNGTGNYTTIQSAIDDAGYGDTIFVFDDSSPYFENIVINVSIKLIGEDKNTTVIDGQNIDSVIKINKEKNWVKNFSIRNSGDDSVLTDAGINIFSDNNTVTDCVIYNNRRGIRTQKIYSGIKSKNNTIKNNDFYENRDSIVIKSRENKIINNRITNNDGIGIHIGGSENVISGNVITSNGCGIHFGGGYDNNVSNNHITKNQDGIYILEGYRIKIERNNFILNQREAFFIYPSKPNPNDRHTWNKNYWSRQRILPKVIIGLWEKYIKIVAVFFVIPIPIMDIDTHPVSKPYDITTTQGCGIT